ncbi:NAD(P)-dependent dehydrogenase (short-subunit alcohol dehydrogenase family) [Actinomadura rupiterrae]|nr:SDR family NAD(P)-dependent oxidoreductase [Actinomadura rupiterrae]MCP2339586.1 NAD(P)-dependent dehydrogenase (short-subunit alcohol dehydrogenase family) [Actinomadura rupiterrae]
MASLEGTSALVTGGGSGIGLACARRLAADGARVTVCGRTEAKLKRAGLPYAVADVTDEDAIAAAVEQAARDAPLRAVVHSAGGSTSIGPIQGLDADAWRRTFELNATGTMLTLKHAPADGARRRRRVRRDLVHRVVQHPPVVRRVRAVQGGRRPPRQARGGRAGRRGRPRERHPARARPHRTGRGHRRRRADPGRLPRLHADLPHRRARGHRRGRAVPRGAESSWITGQVINVDGGHHLRRGPDYRAMFEPMFGPEALRGAPEAPREDPEAPRGGLEAQRGGPEELCGGLEALHGGLEALHEDTEAQRGDAEHYAEVPRQLRGEAP